MQAEQKGLEAQKQDSFNQITQGANRRGLLFSGIPLQEQAQYTGSSFLPAVANLHAKYAQQRFNLQDALAQINQKQQSDAYDIYNKELQTDAARQAAASSASSGISGFGGFGGYGSGQTSAAPQAAAPQTVDTNQLYAYLDRQYKANPNASRSQQDQWVQAWAVANGVNPQNNSSLWSAYDSRYPWAQYSDQAMAEKFGGSGLKYLGGSNSNGLLFANNGPGGGGGGF